MTTILSANGLIEIPEEFRKADALKPGQRCEIERIGQGEYRVRVADGEDSAPGENWVEWLLACPEKGSTGLACLDWTLRTAVVWAELRDDVRRRGFTEPVKDTLIAATAKLHGLTVATRNVDDFVRCGVPVVNPFD